MTTAYLRAAFAALLALATGIPDATMAQSAVEDTDGIVVTGEAARVEEIRKEARAFVAAASAPPIDGQLARWNSPLCPHVTGLDDAVASRVAARVRALASQVGAPVDKADCRTNIVITFTPDARELVGTMERKSSRLLEGTSTPDKLAIRTQPGAVRWWYKTITEGADGSQFSGSSAALTGTIDIPSSGEQRFLDTRSSSLIRTKFRVSLRTATVLIDVPASTGYRLNDVADYVGFVLLARVGMTAKLADADSILSLFTRAPEQARGLSDWDRAYLSALYRTPVDRDADKQRGLIANEMVKDIAK